MNILFLVHTFSDKVIGGEATIGWQLAQALAKRGQRVFVVAPLVERGIKKRSPENLRVYKIPFCHPAPGLDNSNMLRAFLFSLPLLWLKKIDVIHLASSNGPCPFARFKFGRRFVESADIGHDYQNPKIKNELWHDRQRKKEAEQINWRPGFLEKIFDRLTLWFYRVFGLNQDYPTGTDAFACRALVLLKKLPAINPQARLFYVPNGVDVKYFVPRDTAAKRRGQFTFLFVGKLTKTKGLLYLIAAFAKLRRERGNIKLKIIGRGAPSTEKEIRARAAGQSGIVFLGQKSPSEVKKYYQDCDIFVLPSLSEGFGIANLEAMACGRPVISTKVGGIADVVFDGKNGFLVEPADTRALYRAMKRAVENRGQLEKMGRQARARAVREFSWKVVAQKMEQVYNLTQKA
ncbi:MAG: hypothetical protein COU85_02905 [Candidatus Portnoybacteria bacterium CG10_big_fil_rev_8_21_14_0_10_44_7]|uniref:Glycosyl transferase family 1 domain-containing protein n=1 Tax=Candidatus Portnoybacteria bacterium CG10_big_fil_rev_8_21_14_0_10_44_7 TaxID=1974816 RepID=A0A2M8KI47_9BACT|nr:MAG: hypothetical protein COU85_02905 [Candidatus Portnoybacteria bacterium CG10_big_fil_rev_8_21_14_0_10_44_7]